MVGGMDDMILAPEGVGKKAQARAYVERVLRDAAKLAVDLQKRLIEDAQVSDEPWVVTLGYKASESVLDRVMGKAAQVVEVSEGRERPIVFSEKLRGLRADVREEVRAAAREDGRTLVEVLEDRVLRESGLEDPDGVVL